MEIINDIIHINRGNRLLFDYTIDNDGSDYVFEEDDIVTFSVYRKLEMNDEPVINKNFAPEVGTTMVSIDIPNEEMRIGEPINQPEEYWYQIRLNEDVVSGYNSSGPRKLVLYPEGKRIVVENEQNS